MSSADTPGSTTSAPAQQATASEDIVSKLKAAESNEAALRLVWTPGTNLTRKVAEQVANARNISPSGVYGLRKKLVKAEVEKGAPEPTRTDGAGFSIQVVPVPKAPTAQGAPPEAKTTEALQKVSEPWTVDEIKPLIGVLDNLADATEFERVADPQSASQEVLAKMWVDVLNAFKISKEELATKYILLIAASAATAQRFGPGIRKALKIKTKEEKDRERIQKETEANKK